MALTFVLVGAGTPALAQPYGGRITLYSDIDFTETTSSDSGPGILTVYAVHEDVPDAVACWFKVVGQAGFTGTWVGETVHVSGHFADTRTGIHLVYVTCQPLPLHLVTITYVVNGTSANCSALVAVAVEGPDSEIRVNGCDGFGRYAEGSVFCINPDSSCLPVPVEATTWGKIKALYR